MKKRLLSIMLMITFVLYGCGTNTETAQASDFETKTIAVPEQDSAREPTPEESETESVREPESPPTPETTAIPESLPTPETTAIPEVPPTPETTPVPEVPPTPETTSEPEVLPMPETTPVPESPPTPETTQVPEPAPTPNPHTCTWDSGTVTTNATCDSAGIKTFECAGCGNTKTESIAKSSHDYITESTPATCTAAGTTKTYCSICGDVESESEGDAATGHTAGEKQYYFTTPNGPTCSNAANYYINCVVCDENMETGTDPALPHTEVSTVLVEATCNSAGAASIDCSECGGHIRNDKVEPTGEHSWVETEFDVFNMETLEWEKVSGEYCSVCNAQQ